MKLRIIRRGGVAGIPLHATLDTTQLPAPAATDAEAALRELISNRPPSPPLGADRFYYEFVTTDNDKERRIILNENEIPDSLHPLLDLLHNQGHIGSPPP